MDKKTSETQFSNELFLKPHIEWSLVFLLHVLPLTPDMLSDNGHPYHPIHIPITSYSQKKTEQNRNIISNLGER